MRSAPLLNNSRSVCPLNDLELTKIGIPLHHSSCQSDLLMHLSTQKEVKASSDSRARRISANHLLGKMIVALAQWAKEQIEVASDFSSSEEKRFTEESAHLGIDQL